MLQMFHVEVAVCGRHIIDCLLKIIKPSLVPWWQLVLVALDIYRASAAVLILLTWKQECISIAFFFFFAYKKAWVVLWGIFGVAESELFLSYKSDFMVIRCSIRHS